MPRGSSPGERRGGRRPGTPNKGTAEIRTVAQQYGPAAVAALAELAGLAAGTRAEAETARIAALKELLDRAYGKPTQPISGDADAPPLAIEFTWGPAIQPPIEQEAIDQDATSGFVVSFATETD
jgi:hypothetical protein